MPCSFKTFLLVSSFLVQYFIKSWLYFHRKINISQDSYARKRSMLLLDHGVDSWDLTHFFLHLREMLMWTGLKSLRWNRNHLPCLYQLCLSCKTKKDGFVFLLEKDYAFHYSQFKEFGFLWVGQWLHIISHIITVSFFMPQNHQIQKPPL